MGCAVLARSRRLQDDVRRVDRRPAADQAVLAEQVATELGALRAGVVQGSQLLYDGLPGHALRTRQYC